ncbi:hypothetical protein [Telmatospirillum sp. J64-1]|uniref:P-II family nitrogen regulator n=1 Tax=Telmatospirillum sp. J64-1 TaxID=2502183 RepID=UPI00115DF276|nr:hypothetical protein [Telmatospirillum sp. J64-1]
METFKKKRVEIILEQPMVRPMLHLIEKLGVTGYTMLPHLSGKGHTGERGETDLSGALANAMIIVITSQDQAHRLMEQGLKLLTDRTGIIYMSDVEVARDQHF